MRKLRRGTRPCHYEWVKALRDECVAYDVTFVFCGTGRRFVKDGKQYRIEGNGIQSEQAYRSGLSYQGKPIDFRGYRDKSTSPKILGLATTKNVIYGLSSCFSFMVISYISGCGDLTR